MAKAAANKETNKAKEEQPVVSGNPEIVAGVQSPAIPEEEFPEKKDTKPEEIETKEEQAPPVEDVKTQTPAAKGTVDKSTKKTTPTTNRQVKAKKELSKEEAVSVLATLYALTPEEVKKRLEETEEKEAEKKEITKALKDTLLYRKGLSILEKYPDKEEVYMTSNGFGFFEYEGARNHIHLLEDKEIVHVKREVK